MFGKKESNAISNRLSAIKNAHPVQFSQLQAEVRAIKKKVDRETERTPSYKFGIIMTRAGEEVNCIVRDISKTGAKIAMEGVIELPPQFTLLIDGYRAPTNVALAWQNNREAGVSFV